MTNRTRITCEDDSVCGLTKGKDYCLTNIFIRKATGITFGILKDDYGIYNEFNYSRFTTDGKLLDIDMGCQVLCSIKL